jgi:glycosyltransferase A (GT-A) superfamily protein (DUF2064 family)
MTRVPIILITYNRPWHTSQVLKALEEHNIQNLIIFSDAAKTDGEIEGVSETRKLIETIKWTKPDIVYQKENQGLAKSIVSAVNYAFDNADRMILLEDDCVPQKYFFYFISECLKRFENTREVFGITGYTIPLPDAILSSYRFDHYFCQRIGSWGWATWKRAWRYHENDLASLAKKVSQSNIDITQCGNDIPVMLQKLLEGRLTDVWTLNWVLTVYLYGGCYVYPTRSHIENIGMDGSGIHCGRTDRFITKISDAKPRAFSRKIFFDPAISNYFRDYYSILGGPSAGGVSYRERTDAVPDPGEKTKRSGNGRLTSLLSWLSHKMQGR